MRATADGLLSGVASFPSASASPAAIAPPPAPYVPQFGDPCPDPNAYRVPGGIHGSWYDDAARWSQFTFGQQ
jgi:hypothetical protein